MSLFSRLFRRRPGPPPAAPGRPQASGGIAEAAPASLALQDPAPQAPAPPIPPPPTRTPPTLRVPETPADDAVPEDEEETDGADEAEEDPTDPDPLVGTGEPLQISLPTSDSVLAARREAERLALSGPQRITPDDAGGPGSLAETLALLEAQGLVRGEIVDDPVEGFHILYRPTPRPDPP